MLPNKNKITPTQQILATMGIIQWRLRDVIFTSSHHQYCQFHISLTQSLKPSQKTFLIKLYQAIEKLLKLNVSAKLIQTNLNKIASLDSTKVKLIFKHNILSPEVREKSPVLIIDLPNISQCEKTPAIKSALWKLLKENIN